MSRGWWIAAIVMGVLGFIAGLAADPLSGLFNGVIWFLLVGGVGQWISRRRDEKRRDIRLP